MMAAFLIDQVQQKCNPLFQAAWEKKGPTSVIDSDGWGGGLLLLPSPGPASPGASHSPFSDRGGLCWLSYLALEPFARRLWPQTLISWGRLLAGRISDPRVGQDLLIGSLAGTGWFVLLALARLILS